MTPAPFPDRSSILSQLAGPTVGLFTFAAMLLFGIWRGNPVEIVLFRALAGLIAATTLGCIAGALADRILRDAPKPIAASPNTLSVSTADTHEKESTR